MSGKFNFLLHISGTCTLWWFLSLHFGFRARDESRKHCWDNLEVQIDPKIAEKCWCGRPKGVANCKTRHDHQRQFKNPKVRATPIDARACTTRYSRAIVHLFFFFPKRKPPLYFLFYFTYANKLKLTPFIVRHAISKLGFSRVFML